MSEQEYHQAAGEQVVGAVLVVGGGIAGMQASLDLADQGFKVFMVEQQAAIGGKMAQLDKTFPTNDCAMCTISPKLVEVGRHPNIQVLVNSEVQEVRGQPGNFSVRVSHKPAYVNPDLCVACGECTQVCPVVIPDTFNESLNTRRAISKLYPQAIPRAFSIEKRGISPCRDACPAGQKAQGYIALIREGRYADALRVIKMDNPFPGICGRICNHRCETACSRGQVDEPVNIRALKRFVSDQVYSQPRQPVLPVPVLHEQRVAVIGAGPCGLTAAQDLTLAGYAVTVFETMPVAGGMLRLGVPEYRLPAAIIEREVQDIIDLGIDLRLETRIDNLDDLFEQGFAAVLISVGAHEGIRLRISGADLEGVLINTHFLRDVRLGRYEKDALKPAPPLGERVLILGGGNVAIDCARTAVRLGKEVHLACLEERESMPAHLWEVEEAEREGVRMHTGLTFEEILGSAEGKVQGVACQKVSSFSFDDRGRLNVETVPNSREVIDCDTVIFSIGQRAGLAFIPDDSGVGLTERRTIAVNPNTMAATREGVFAAGDSVSGTAFVVEAVASGHRAAESILLYLKGKPLEQQSKPPLPVVRLSAEEIEHRQARGEIKPRGRVPLPQLQVGERIRSFDEVEGGYSDEQAQSEAARCLACGICSECMSCVFACGVKAIDHNAASRESELQVGAVILAPGFQTFQAESAQEFGFGRYPNVITALQYERFLSASGPTFGHIQRPSDGQKPRRIAFLQCVGSRDQAHDYCSSVCCMYATKEAIMTKEHHSEIEIEIFLMDMRAFSKGYQEYFNRARQRYGIQYSRCRVSALHQDPHSQDILLYGLDENGSRRQERFDLVVLSVGMEIPAQVCELGRRLKINLDEHGFCLTGQLEPLQTSRPGFYAIGPFREPKDIPESVVEASAACAGAAALLHPARFSLTKERVFPPEREVRGEEPRIGVFVCHCGSNIGGYLDVPNVAEYARTLPYVVHSEANLYTCSQDSIRHISETIEERGLNRVVVASCTPMTHAPLFQDSLRAAGLNPFLFEMANIRNHCSWVHSHEWDLATEKASDLVRMAAARAAHLQPQFKIDVPVQQSALVVGGGAAGMKAALSLAEQGFPVHLVEKDAELGGNLRFAFTVPPESSTANGRQAVPPQELLRSLVERVKANTKIFTHLGSQVIRTKGFQGNFCSVVQKEDRSQVEIQHGVTILATGGVEYRGGEYGYGSDPDILTQQEFDALLSGASTARGEQKPLDQVRSLVMIQCVGPAEQYCSRVCCTLALKNALAFKARHPQAEVTILYKDIRTYGFKERLYTQAREAGIVFIRYTDEQPPQIVGRGPLQMRAWEPGLKRWIRFEPDVLVLSMPVVPGPGTKDLAALFKVPLDANRFFMEAHVKLRPVDFATDGVFMAGTAHYPKLLDETLIHAQAAAARAARILSQPTLTAGGQVAVVDESLCTGCLTCVRICPYQVPKISSSRMGTGKLTGAAYIEPSVCQGCGSCAAECPARAIQLMHYTDLQMEAKVSALFKKNELPVLQKNSTPAQGVKV